MLSAVNARKAWIESRRTLFAEQLQLRFCSNARRRIWPLTNWHVTDWACAASNQSHSDCVLDIVSSYAMAITICVAVGN